MNLEFLYDGESRHRDALEMRIRSDLIGAYGSQLASATFWQRLTIRRAISREVNRRLRAAGITGQSLYWKQQ